MRPRYYELSSPRGNSNRRVNQSTRTHLLTRPGFIEGFMLSPATAGWDSGCTVGSFLAVNLDFLCKAHSTTQPLGHSAGLASKVVLVRVTSWIVLVFLFHFSFRERTCTPKR